MYYLSPTAPGGVTLVKPTAFVREVYQAISETTALVLLTTISDSTDSGGSGDFALSDNLEQLDLRTEFGITARTAVDTWRMRAITDVTGRTRVTNGDGISGNPIVDLDASGVMAGDYGTADSVPTLTIDDTGRATVAINTLIAILSTQVSDFTEAAQDVVGAMATDSADIDFTYDDVTGLLTAALIPAGVLAALLTVDGTGSGLDADLLDGHDTSYFTGLISTVASDLAAHLSDASDAHDASAVSFVPASSIAATDVQAAVVEVELDAQAAQSTANTAVTNAATAQTTVDNHIADTSAAHAASAIGFTPAGTIAATDVQAAIVEVEGDAATAEADAQTAITAAAAAQSTANAAIPKSLVDAKGDLLAASADNVVGRLPVGTDGDVLTADAASTLGVKWAAAGGSSYTDEKAQDAVGASLTDTATIDFTYDDAGNAITADVKDGSLGTAKLSFDPATQAELDTHTSATGASVHGLGTISTQAANNVAISGGAIDGTTVGATTRAAVKGTNVDARVTDTATNTEPEVLTVEHDSSAAGAANFGSGIFVRGKSSTTSSRAMWRMGVTWAVAADATRVARAKHYTYDSSGAVEAFQYASSSGNPSIGFLGASAQTRYASTGDLRQALIDFGLYTTGGASPLDLNGGALAAGSLTLTTALAIAQGGTGGNTAATARTALGLAIGTDVQAWNAKLDTLVALTWAASKIIYLTSSSAMATADFDITSISWTATFIGSTTAGVNSYDVQVARSMRIGKFTMVTGRLHTSLKGSGGNAMAGNLRIAGLPYTSKNTANQQVCYQVSSLECMVFGTTFVTGNIIPNATQMRIYIEATGTSATNAEMTVASLGANPGIFWTAVYEQD